MSDLSKALDDAKAIKKGLFLMGKNRKLALSNHVTVDLIEELEEKADALVKALESQSK